MKKDQQREKGVSLSSNCTVQLCKGNSSLCLWKNNNAAYFTLREQDGACGVQMFRKLGGAESQYITVVSSQLAARRKKAERTISHAIQSACVVFKFHCLLHSSDFNEMASTGLTIRPSNWEDGGKKWNTFALIIRTGFSFWTRSFLLKKHFLHRWSEGRPEKNLDLRIRILFEFREGNEVWNMWFLWCSLNDSNKNTIYRSLYFSHPFCGSPLVMR